MSPTIRKAEESDLAGIAGLFDLYRVYYKKDPDMDSGKQFLAERIRKKDSVIFVALTGNKIVGFTQLYPLFSSLQMKRSWLLNDLFVLEEYRGKGISRQLINAAKQLAKETNAAWVMLETEKTNTVGNKLYPSCDFVLYDKNNFYQWDNL